MDTLVEVPALWSVSIRLGVLRVPEVHSRNVDLFEASEKLVRGDDRGDEVREVHLAIQEQEIDRD